MRFPPFDDRSAWREGALAALLALWDWAIDAWHSNRGYLVAAVSGTLGILLAIWLLLSAFWGWLFAKPPRPEIARTTARGIPEEEPSLRRPLVRPRMPGRPLDPLFADAMPAPFLPPQRFEEPLTPVAQEEEEDPVEEVEQAATARFDRSPPDEEPEPEPEFPLAMDLEPEPEPEPEAAEEDDMPRPAWQDDEPLVADRDEPRAPIEPEEEPEPEFEPEPEPEPVVDLRLEPDALDPAFGSDQLLARLIPPPPAIVERKAESDWKPAPPRPEPPRAREESTPVSTRVVSPAPPPVERRPRLVLRWEEHPGARPGDLVTINLLVSNVGEATARNVELSLKLPATVGHPEGDDLEQELGTLQIGESRQIPLIIKPGAAGRLELPVKARAIGAEANSTGILRVVGTDPLPPERISSNTTP